MTFLFTDTDPAIPALLDAIDAARNESYPLLLSMRRLGADAPPNPTDILDALAREEGYQPLGTNWIEVPRRIALKIATHLIASELAYPTEVVETEPATDLANQFLSLFNPPARYFTNGACSGPFAVYDLAGGEVLGWRSLSAAPFDNGVIVVSAERVGMLWAEDAP
ncbi:hypothetical protein OSCT_1043 [Oscillochloris trichoides DG-6]|uniref:Uncharacterized protein n=1 Tax=Oscillochloris trichoides DG-6 TaxID=765420 RepID=E1ICJ2_9CHLR|nr:hypothetical protein [Oscillochloris trichoides]EFO81120.1 hypothetical protein OSCT_1043 [Oscillochloris trichoides DG-6]